MKTFSLTALIFATCLFIANLLVSHTDPSRKSNPFIDAPDRVGLAAAAPAVRAPAANPPEVNVPVSNGSPAEPAVVADDQAGNALPDTPTTQLDAFIASVTDGQAGQVVGVFAQDLFALPVVQQPEGQPSYVADANNLVTQFASPKTYGVIALLAHNFLSGRLFSNLRENQEVVIVYGDGQRQVYRITLIQRYQALESTSAYSDFILDGDPGQATISAVDLFNRVYTQADHLVFQTCIDANGDPSWGRLFVIAEKMGG
jgi:hypothetical protein